MERAEPGGLSVKPIPVPPGPLIQPDGGPFLFRKISHEKRDKEIKRIKKIKKAKKRYEQKRAKGKKNGSTPE